MLTSNIIEDDIAVKAQVGAGVGGQLFLSKTFLVPDLVPDRATSIFFLLYFGC